METRFVFWGGRVVLVNMFKPTPVWCGLLLVALFPGLSGCQSTSASKYAEFVKTIHFSELDTFEYKHTLIAGMNFRESEEYLLEQLSEQVLSEALRERGFAHAPGAGDFFVVAKWRKAVSAVANAFEPIDGPAVRMSRYRDAAQLYSARVSVIVEIYAAPSGQLFWRKELPNAFDALQFTEDRVRRSLQQAIADFPQHVAKHPELPTIQ